MGKEKNTKNEDVDDLEDVDLALAAKPMAKGKSKSALGRRVVQLEATVKNARADSRLLMTELENTKTALREAGAHSKELATKLIAMEGQVEPMVATLNRKIEQASQELSALVRQRLSAPTVAAVIGMAVGYALGVL